MIVKVKWLINLVIILKEILKEDLEVEVIVNQEVEIREEIEVDQIKDTKEETVAHLHLIIKEKEVIKESIHHQDHQVEVVQEISIIIREIKESRVIGI
jgi:hypothetical protein